MCGLLGFINAEKDKLASPERLFSDMLFIGTRRGSHGTGAVVVTQDKLLTHKSSIWGPDFVGTKTYQTVIGKNLKDAVLAFGHNRHATRGTISDENAHPFQHKHITLAHNGHIQNAWWLLPNGVSHDVDSFAACWAIAEKGEKEALESLRGAFALTWYNSKDGTFNIARNEERELAVMYAADSDGKPLNIMLFMSEYGMLYDVMVHNRIRFDGKFKIVPPYAHYKFNLDNPREFQRIPFARPQSTQTVGGGAGGNPYYRAASSRTATKRPPTTSEMEIIERKLARFTKKERERYGVPGSRKKLRAAIARLADSRYQIGDDILVYADSYTKYKNQRDRGVIVGSKYSDVDVAIQISNASQSLFDSMKKANGTYVTVVGAKKGPHGRTILVCGVTDDTLKRLTRGTPVTQDAPKEDENKKVYLPGPSGTLIEASRWKALAAAGCSICTAVVNPHFAKEVIWHGDCPICHICADDEATLRQHGIEKVKQQQVH